MTPHRVNPDDPHHKKLESDVIEWLEDIGYIVESHTYHERNSKDFQRCISRMSNLTALSVRTTADRIAIHRRDDVAFHIECKTISGDHANLAVEALPLAIHKQNSKFGIRCLYIVRDVAPGREYEGSFWAEWDIGIDMLFVPEPYHATPLEECLAAFYRGIRVKRIGKTANGSNDPYVRVPREAFKTSFFPCWRTATLCGDMT